MRMVQRQQFETLCISKAVENIRFPFSSEINEKFDTDRRKHLQYKQQSEVTGKTAIVQITQEMQPPAEFRMKYRK